MKKTVRKEIGSNVMLEYGKDYDLNYFIRLFNKLEDIGCEQVHLSPFETLDGYHLDIQGFKMDLESDLDYENRKVEEYRQKLRKKIQKKNKNQTK